MDGLQENTSRDPSGKMENKVHKSIDVSEGMNVVSVAASGGYEHKSINLTENGGVHTNYMTKESQPAPAFDSLTIEPMPEI